ncbi:unnamed protein product, partial [Didymodactylos carnosus]
MVLFTSGIMGLLSGILVIAVVFVNIETDAFSLGFGGGVRPPVYRPPVGIPTIPPFNPVRIPTWKPNPNPNDGDLPDIDGGNGSSGGAAPPFVPNACCSQKPSPFACSNGQVLGCSCACKDSLMIQNQ